MSVKVRRIAVVGFRSVGSGSGIAAGRGRGNFELNMGPLEWNNEVRCLGKSSLCVQFVQGHFVDTYLPTIENAFTKVMKFHGCEYTAEIIDTAGQDEYSILQSQHAIGIHGYVLVYSIASKSSLETLGIIRDKILNYTGTNWVPCVLVGNKADLEVSQRQVTDDEGRALAVQWKCAFTEASAKNNLNIERVFELMLDEIEKASRPPDDPASKKCRLM